MNAMTGAYTNVLTEGQYPGLSVGLERLLRPLPRRSRSPRATSTAASAASTASTRPRARAVTDLGPDPHRPHERDRRRRRAPRSSESALRSSAVRLRAQRERASGPSRTRSRSRRPASPTSPYAAALSPRWQPMCSPYVPGILEPALCASPFPDARGVPLSLSDGGFLLTQTAAVCCFAGDARSPINTILVISGFVGMPRRVGQRDRDGELLRRAASRHQRSRSCRSRSSRSIRACRRASSDGSATRSA